MAECEQRGTSTATPEARGRHERLAAERKPDNGRADLSPELWAAVREYGYSATAESRQWRAWLLGCMDSEDLDVGDVEHLLAARTSAGRMPGTPSKDRLWSYKSAQWRKDTLGRAEPTKPKGKFDGGLGPKRKRAKDYDGPGEISPDAARSWV